MSQSGKDASEGKKPLKKCVNFEPQAWRKTLCKNCFKSKLEHNASDQDPGAASDSGDEVRPPTPRVEPRGVDPPCLSPSGGARSRAVERSRSFTTDEEEEEDDGVVEIPLRRGSNASKFPPGTPTPLVVKSSTPPGAKAENKTNVTSPTDGRMDTPLASPNKGENKTSAGAARPLGKAPEAGGNSNSSTRALTPRGSRGMYGRQMSDRSESGDESKSADEGRERGGFSAAMPQSPENMQAHSPFFKEKLSGLIGGQTASKTAVQPATKPKDPLPSTEASKDARATEVAALPSDKPKGSVPAWRAKSTENQVATSQPSAQPAAPPSEKTGGTVAPSGERVQTKEQAKFSASAAPSSEKANSGTVQAMPLGPSSTSVDPPSAQLSGVGEAGGVEGAGGSESLPAASVPRAGTQTQAGHHTRPDDVGTAVDVRAKGSSGSSQGSSHTSDLDASSVNSRTKINNDPPLQCAAEPAPARAASNTPTTGLSAAHNANANLIAGAVPSFTPVSTQNAEVGRSSSNAAAGVKISSSSGGLSPSSDVNTASSNNLASAENSSTIHHNSTDRAAAAAATAETATATARNCVLGAAPPLTASSVINCGDTPAGRVSSYQDSTNRGASYQDTTGRSAAVTSGAAELGQLDRPASSDPQTSGSSHLSSVDTLGQLRAGEEVRVGTGLLGVDHSSTGPARGVAPTRAKVEATITLSGVGANYASQVSSHQGAANESGSSHQGSTNQRGPSVGLINEIPPYNGPPASGSYRYIEPNDPRLSYNNFVEPLHEQTTFDPNRAPAPNYYRTPGFPEISGGSHGGVTAAQQQQQQQHQQQQQGYTPQPSARRVRSLFHHLPGEGPTDATPSSQQYQLSPQQQQQQQQQWFSSAAPAHSQTDDDLFAHLRQPSPSSPATQGPGGRRQRRRRLSSYDARTPCGVGGGGDISVMDRNDAMMEGQRMLMESLREKVAVLEERCDRSEREKASLADLLGAKKSDYELMKRHYASQLNEADEEVHRLKSEKARLLDKLQLPESERASLAMEEGVIASLKRRLEEQETSRGEVAAENEDLRGEVRDLQLVMAELHDQFRDEEAIEFRELQKELESTAKNCRILQFKLRKTERRVEQLESDRSQCEEKIRHFESCFQSSDDKRRIRVLEEDLRMSKEVSVRMHDELEKQEQRRVKGAEENDRLKNALNEADNRRLCLQNQLDSMAHELNTQKIGATSPLSPRASPSLLTPPGDSDVAAKLAQLTRDLAASAERETDVKEQLRFSEEQFKLVRKKLSEVESENEMLSMQIRKLSSSKSSKFNPPAVKGAKPDEPSSEVLSEKEQEMRLQMELADQELKVVRRKYDELQQDNDNLLLAIKHLRAKIEPGGSGGAGRSGTPAPDTPRSTKDLLANIVASTSGGGPTGVAGPTGGAEAERRVAEAERRVEEGRKELGGARERVGVLEKENSRLATELSRVLEANKKTSTEPGAFASPLPAKDLDERLEASTKAADFLRAELEQCRAQIRAGAEELAKSKKDYDSNKKKLKKANEELEVTREAKVQLEALQRSYEESKQLQEKNLAELSVRSEELRVAKVKLDELQKTFDDSRKNFEKPAEVKGGVEREPTSWKWDKQELEKQNKEWKKKYDDLQAEAKKTSTKVKNGDVTKDATEAGRRLKDVTETLEKKELVLKSLTAEKQKLEADLLSSKKASKLEILELTMQKEKLATEVDKHKKAHAELESLRKKLVQSEEAWVKEKTRLESELKRAEEQLAAATKKTGKSGDVTSLNEKLTSENKTLMSENKKLTNERRELTDEVNALKKELAEKGEARRREKEGLQGGVGGAKKGAGGTGGAGGCSDCERLQAEVDSLTARGSSNAKPSPSDKDAPVSKTSAIPDKTAKSSPVQRLHSDSKTDDSSSATSTIRSGGVEGAEVLAERARQEERWGSRTRELEASLTRVEGQLAILRGENKELIAGGQKTFAELKGGFEKATKDWEGEREEFNKRCKGAEEMKAKMAKLEKSVEELTGRLKAEEARRREVENSNKVNNVRSASAAKSEKTLTTDDKSKTAATDGKKTADFLNKFEKFGGGTPRPVRRLSVPAAPEASAPPAPCPAPPAGDTTGKTPDILGEFQKQLCEVEKGRLADREELLEKLERQRKEFEAELEHLKTKSRLLDTKSQELTVHQKNFLEAHCLLDTERSKWIAERSKLEGQLDETLKVNRSDRNKVTELIAEIKRLQVLYSDNTLDITSLTSDSSIQSSSTSSSSPSSTKAKVQTTTLFKTGSASTAPAVLPTRKFGGADDKKSEPAPPSVGLVKVSHENGKFGRKSTQSASDALGVGNSSSSSVGAVGAAAAAAAATSSPASGTTAARTSMPTNKFSRAATFQKT